MCLDQGHDMGTAGVLLLLECNAQGKIHFLGLRRLARCVISARPPCTTLHVTEAIAGGFEGRSGTGRKPRLLQGRGGGIQSVSETRAATVGAQCWGIVWEVS